jgi:glycerate 2-kinase
MIELLRLADRETLVIELISGGGSSMMALPAEGLTLEDLRAMSRSLLTVPASIDEMNAVRKHIDPLKGGGMRKNAENAGGFMTLVLSDVPVTKTGIADDPSVISSGPTVGDDSTFGEAIKVLTEHGIWEQTPAAIRKYLQDNSDQDDNETLPKDSPLLSEAKSQYVILANNDQAMEAAAEKAVELGYHIRLIGCRNGSIVNKIKAEVTQEIENIWNVITPSLTPQDRVTFASFSTDGVDGHSDLAGAIAENNTLRLAKQKGLEYKTYLTDFDSASFFKQLGLGIEIGPTGTNVADIILVLMNNSERKLAFIFGGEATVKMTLPEGQKPGFGGRNTHLALLAAEKLNHLQ